MSVAAVNTNAGNDGVTEYWTYDPAGNRHDTGSGFASWTYDNLNRLTASPTGRYTNNTLGDQTIDPAGNRYYWDQLNRMTSFTGSNSITTPTECGF